MAYRTRIGGDIRAVAPWFGLTEESVAKMDMLWFALEVIAAIATTLVVWSKVRQSFLHRTEKAKNIQRD